MENGKELKNQQLTIRFGGYYRTIKTFGGATARLILTSVWAGQLEIGSYPTSVIFQHQEVQLQETKTSSQEMV